MTFCINYVSYSCNDHVLVRDTVTFSFKENRLIAARIRDGGKLLNGVNCAGVAGIMIIPYQQVTVGKRVIVRFSQIRIDSECPVSVIEVRCDLDTACDYFFILCYPDAVVYKFICDKLLTYKDRFKLSIAELVNQPA